MYVDRLTQGRQRISGSLRWMLALALLTLLALSCLALPASAQAPALTLSSANLRLAPEYDDPGLLVILNGTVDNVKSFPQEITLPVPAGARGLQTTEQDGDQLLLRQATGPADGKISYALNSKPTFQTEYYLDREPAGNDRVIKYSWQAPYAIKDLSVTIQEPARASNFAVTPQADSSFKAADGLTTYQIKRANVAAGDVLDFEIRYTKNDTAPSFPRNQNATTGSQGNAAGDTNAVGAEAAAAPGAGSPPILPYVLIGVGLAALVAAAVYWFLERRAAPAQAMSGRAVRASGAQPGQPGRSPGTDSARFCPKCGRPFAAEDRFCGQCGTPRGA